MENFSLLVQKKYDELNLTNQRIFIDEFDRRKKSKGVAFLLWLLFGWHYAYLKKWGWLILFVLTAGGFFIWWLVDLFRVSKLVDDYNNDLSSEIMRDITLLFGNEEKINELVPNNNENKNVNAHYLTPRKNSEGNYVWIMLPLIVLVIGFVLFFTKPDNLTMGNKIVDKMMKNNPELVIGFKNLFFGKEMKGEYVNNFISNSLSNAGYTNVEVYNYDFVLLRKIKIKEKLSGSNLISAYGILGQTFVNINYSLNSNENETPLVDESEFSENLPENTHSNEEIIRKNSTFLYSKNSFVNNAESKKYIIAELKKGDKVYLIEYGDDMHKVEIIQNGKLLVGYVVPSSIFE